MIQRETNKRVIYIWMAPGGQPESRRAAAVNANNWPPLWRIDSTDACHDFRCMLPLRGLWTMHGMASIRLKPDRQTARRTKGQGFGALIGSSRPP